MHTLERIWNCFCINILFKQFLKSFPSHTPSGFPPASVWSGFAFSTCRCQPVLLRTTRLINRCENVNFTHHLGAPDRAVPEKIQPRASCSESPAGTGELRRFGEEKGKEKKAGRFAGPAPAPAALFTIPAPSSSQALEAVMCSLTPSAGPTGELAFCFTVFPPQPTK